MKAISITYRITALTIAFLMFVTSVGFTVDLHYCKGDLKTFNFFGKAQSCHEIGEGMNDCPSHKKMLEAKKSDGNALSQKSCCQKTKTNTKKIEDTAIDHKSCCSNKTLRFQSDQDQQNQIDNAKIVSPQLQYLTTAFAEVFLKSSVVETESPSCTLYKPPLIQRDIYVLFETYLI